MSKNIYEFLGRFFTDFPLMKCRATTKKRLHYSASTYSRYRAPFSGIGAFTSVAYQPNLIGLSHI